jgi:hypothetical protein
MRKNRESAAAKASLAGLTPAASNAPLGCHQTSSTASVSAHTSASTPSSQNGNHNGSQNGGRVALNSSSQLHINGSDKAFIGTNKSTNNLNYSNNSTYGHSTHNNNTTTITSIPVKAVTPGIPVKVVTPGRASRTRATPAVQIGRINYSSSPTRYRTDEGTEETELEDRERERERPMAGSNGARIQSNNNNQNQNHNRNSTSHHASNPNQNNNYNNSQNETPNEHKNQNQNQNQNYSSNQNEHRQVAGSPSMSDVSSRLQSIEMKLDIILKHLGI